MLQSVAPSAPRSHDPLPKPTLVGVLRRALALPYLAAVCAIGAVGCQGTELAGASAHAPTSTTCAQGDAIACGSLGEKLLAQSHAGAAADHAYALLMQACTGGSAHHCAIVGRAYATGTYLPRSPSTAASFLQRACLGGDTTTCDDLADVLEQEAAASAPSAAAHFYTQACTLGRSDACRRAVRAHETQRLTASNVAR